MENTEAGKGTTLVENMVQWHPNKVKFANVEWTIQENWFNSFEIYHSSWLSCYKPPT
jgi:hypothetical protein